MTNRQIIKNAIERAELSGFNIEIFWHKLKNPDSTVSPSTRSDVFVDENIDKIMEHLTDLLFDSSFPKAFWGEKIEEGVAFLEAYSAMGDVRIEPRLSFEELKSWEFHLQQIVLLPTDERFKYLEKFLIQ